MRRLLLGVPIVLVLALCAALAALAWVVGSEPGLRWAARQAEHASEGRLRIEAPSGTLDGGVVIDVLRFADDSAKVEAHDVRGRLNLLALLAGRVELSRLDAKTVAIELLDGKAPPRERMALPFGIALTDVSIDQIELVQAGKRYRLEDVKLAKADFGARGIAANGSFLYPHERFPVRARADVHGPLDALRISLAWQAAGTQGDATLALADSKLASLQARAGPLDLATIDSRLPRTAVTLTLNAGSTARGYAGNLHLANALAGTLDAGRAPLERVEADFTTQELASAAFPKLSIALSGGGRLAGSGEGDLQRFSASLKASRIDLQALRSTLRSTALAGPLEVDLRRDEQSVRGALAQAGMRIEAHAVRRADVVELRTLRAQAAGGEAAGSGRLTLGAPLRFEAALKISRFNPAALGRYPEGSLNGTLEARGSYGDVNAQWNVADSTLLGRRVASRGAGKFSRERVQGLQADVRFGASRATLRGDFGQRGDRLAWDAVAPDLRELAAALSGRAEARGVLSGTWREPQIEAALQAEAPGIAAEALARGSFAPGGRWSGEIVSASNRGTYPLRLRAPVALQIAPGRVEVGRLEADLAQGHILVREALWEPGRLQSSGELSGLPAQWLVRLGGFGDRVRATMLVDGKWSLTTAARLDGTLTLRRRSGDLFLAGKNETPLALNELILDARFDAGRMTGRLDAASRYGSVALNGTVDPEPGAAVPGFGRDSRIALQGRLQFAELSTLLQPYLAESRVDGRLSAELSGSGTFRQPAIRGQVRGEGISYEMPPYGVYLRNGQLRADFDGTQLVVDSFSLQGGAGEITAKGALPLRFAEGGAKLHWVAQNFSVLERPDLRLVASGEGDAGFDGKRLALAGILRAERGHLGFDRDRLPKLGEDVVVLGQPRIKPSGARARLPVALDLQLDLGRNLTVNAQGLEGRLEGILQLATSADGELRGYGQVNLANAVYYAYGQRLQVDPGVLIFDGALDNPALQVTAWRRNQAVEAGVQVSGSARAPRVQLVSQPLVPEGERLSWLVLGRAPADATKADLGLLQAAAGALLARGEAMPLDRKIARSLGLDEVSFRGSGEVQDRVVAFGKRLSDRLYVSYEQGLGQIASNLVKLDFSLGRRWSLRAETGTSSGAGIYYRYSWD